MTTPHNPLLSGDEPEKYIPSSVRDLYICGGQSACDWLKRAMELIHQDIYFAYDGNNIAQLSRKSGIHPDNIHEIIQHQASVMKDIKPAGGAAPSTKPSNANEQAQPCTCCAPNTISDISDLTKRSVVKPLQLFLELLGTPDKHHCPARADLAQLANSIAAQLDQLLSLLPTDQVPHRR